MIGVIILAGCIKIAENTIKNTVISPNTKYNAVIFSRDAGATKAHNIHVSILKKDKKLNDAKGNIFIANRTEFVEVKWEDNNNLNIIYDYSKESIFLQKK
jgi:hypothetical protein